MVVALGAHAGEDADGGLDVVVQDVRSGVKHLLQSRPRPGEIRYKHLYAAVWIQVPDAVDATGEYKSSAVGEVVPVDGGDYAVTQTHGLHRLGQPRRLLQVNAGRTAGGHRAIVAAAGAYIAQDHERGGAAVPAFADVGAMGLLADRVQLLAPHQRFQFDVPGAARGPYFQPFR